MTIRTGDTGPGTATLDSFAVDTAGTVRVTTTVRLRRNGLPNLVAQLDRGDLKMMHNETWSRIGEGRVQEAHRQSTR